MKALLWLIVIGSFAGILAWFWKARERMREKQRASEQRFAEMMAQLKPAVPPANAPSAAKPELPLQRLLFEAAGKAGEAGEPVLSIQLYARLLARYPDTPFATQAKAAVESQKKKLAKA